MLTSLQQFIYMHGYGAYVWSAYSTVMVLLTVQWFRPWRRYRRYLKSVRVTRDTA